MEKLLVGNLVGQKYFLRGMEIFRERFDTCSRSGLDQTCTAVAFIFASDDLQWCRLNFESVYFSRFSKREQDMALLQHCDHILLRYEVAKKNL